MLVADHPNKRRMISAKSTRFVSLMVFLVGFYFSIQNQSVVATSVVVLSSVLLMLAGNSVRFSALLIIPVFASIQLLFAFSVLASSSNYSVTYGPLDFPEYIEIASPLLFGYLIPFFLFKLELQLHDQCQTSRPLHVEAICVEAVKWGLVSEIVSNFIGSVPVVGALVWYAALLWKLAIPVLFFSTSKKKLAVGLALLLLTMAVKSSLYWNFLMVTTVGVLYGYSSGALKLSRVVLIMMIGVFGSVVIQTFKHVQRSNMEVSPMKELRTIVGSFRNETQRYVLFESLIGRLHQGLHDSFVYDRCGSVECSDPTIIKSAVGTLLPRFLYPDKPSFNSEKLKKLGGYTGMGNSFITISGCAEAYANYGRFGGAAFMVLFSFFILFYFRWLGRMFVGVPSIFLIIPFYHVMRVEVDFYHWFTCLFYGTIILRLFYSRMEKNFLFKGQA